MTANAPSNTIFINYRGGDADFAAAMVRERLSEQFGQDRVFWPARSILPGEGWSPALTEAVRNSVVMITLIGPAWLTATDEHGTRRIDRRTDWVRREIEAAAQSGMWIIPVLLAGAPILTRDKLPASLATLVDRQYLRLDPSNARSLLDRLVDLIGDLLPEADHHIADSEAVSNANLTRSELVAAVTEGRSGHGRSADVVASSRIRREPVPDGPIRDFFDRLHELHRWAGEPSTRRIATSLGAGVISYGTVYSAFRGPQVPRWGHVELIIEALGGDVDVFRRAWVSARDAEDKLERGAGN